MENPFEIILQKLEKIEKSIEELKNQNKESKIKVQELLSCVELAEYINLKVSTIYSLVHQKKIPYYKKGKLYFNKSEIDKWILESPHKTISDLNIEADEYLFRHPLN
jgi:excisionase family DNA binding protein